MATYTADHKTASGRTDSVRHSKADAISEREFELLVQSCRELDGYYALQARFVVFAAGRLGLRAGEIAHCRASWVDWRRNRIEIPIQQDCQKGRDGGPCGYCRQNAIQMAEYNPDLSLAEAKARMWKPKTTASARAVPFDFSPRVELAVEQFFDRFEAWPVARQAVNRRLDRAAEHAEIEGDRLYPHALRATAATFHAARGLSVLPLKSMFGWSKLSTAHKYIAGSDENTSRAVRAAHSR